MMQVNLGANIQQEYYVSNEDGQNQKTVFMNQFFESISEQLTIYHSVTKPGADYENTAAQFIEDLKMGEATLENNPAICRFVCVSIQAALEKALVKFLQSNEIKEVEAIFLTPLPCTPLRSEKKEWTRKQDESNLNEWTVEIRKETVRDLVAHGALLTACYEEQSYVSLSETYENMKKNHSNIIDCRLKEKIPSELVGATYSFRDKNQNIYFINTQGIQIHQHGQTPLEQWKIWLGADGMYPSVNKRRNEMVEFIKENTIDQYL